MKSPKYIIVTDHLAGYNNRDEIKELEAKDVLEAMTEVTNMVKFEENLYCACVYEKIPKTNDYQQILRTGDGNYFCQEESVYNLRRYAEKTNVFYEFKSR